MSFTVKEFKQLYFDYDDLQKRKYFIFSVAMALQSFYAKDIRRQIINLDIATTDF